MARIKYGLQFPDETTDLDIELYCFREGWPVASGGLGKIEHFWKCVEIVAPTYKRNPWGDRTVVALCTYKLVSITGCASSSKSGTLALWGLINFICSPNNTLVAVTTTSVTKARKLIWGDIKERFTRLHGLDTIFKLVDTPTPMIRHRDSQFSERSSISLIPAEQSKAAESIQKLVGLKNERVFLLIDEGPEMPLGIVAALSNLNKNPYFQCVILGNAADVFDPHGILSTPKYGWSSITVDDEGWETERDGYCLHFDGFKSPNLTNGDQWPFLYSSKDLEQDTRDLGENSPTFWRQVRGFWRVGGSEDVLYTVDEITKNDGMKQNVVEDSVITIGGGDAAFTKGGDRFILYFLKLGRKKDGKMAAEFTEYVHLKIDLIKNQLPASYQYVAQIMAECQKRGVQPFHFGLDATGAGQVLYELLCEQWSRSCRRIGFGEKASNTKVAPSDKKTAAELYRLRVDELWAVGVRLLRDGRICGICPDLAREMIARRFLQGDKISVESKKDMKARTGQSPDIADAAFVALDVARQCGLVSGISSDASAMAAWENNRKSYDQAHETSLPFHYD